MTGSRPWQWAIPGEPAESRAPTVRRRFDRCALRAGASPSGHSDLASADRGATANYRYPTGPRGTSEISIRKKLTRVEESLPENRV